MIFFEKTIKGEKKLKTKPYLAGLELYESQKKIHEALLNYSKIITFIG